MNENESICTMLTHFTDTINELKALGRDVPNVGFVNKILPSLPWSWEPKVTAILEAKDLSKLKHGQLLVLS